MAFEVFNDLFANEEAHAKAILVLAGGPLNLAKELEELVHLICAEASALVDHLNLNLLAIRVVVG